MCNLIKIYIHDDQVREYKNTSHLVPVNSNLIQNHRGKEYSNSSSLYDPYFRECIFLSKMSRDKHNHINEHMFSYLNKQSIRDDSNNVKCKHVKIMAVNAKKTTVQHWGQRVS